MLIPRGSRLIGQAEGDAKPGQHRIFVEWSRLIRPDGVAIRIGSPASDTLGGSGITGRVNSHFFARFANAALQSALTAGVAIAALRALPQFKLSAAAFETGVGKADWPARMQRLAQGRLAALTPPGSELWVDGGHNSDGGRAIANALADLEERVPRPVILVVGMLSTKDCGSFLINFAGLARRVVAVPIADQEKAFPAERVAEFARAAGIPAVSSARLLRRP